METQPSDQFWLKASEDALFRNSQTNRKIIGKWKMVAAAIAIALVSLSAYVVYMQSEIGALNNKLSLKEKQNNTTIAAENKISQSGTVIQPPVKVVEENVQAKTAASVATIHKHATRNKVQNVMLTDGGTMTQEEVAKDLKEHSTSVTYSQTVPKGSSTVSNNNAEQETNSNQDKSLALINASNVTIPQNDISNPAIDYANDKDVVTKNTHSKFSVALFYEPYISDEQFENESSDIAVVNNVVSSEEEVKPYQIGARVEYHISSHLSFITGCAFYNFKVSVDPTTIFAQKLQDGKVGYAFQTSVGTVNCPYNEANTYVGDALIVKGEYTADYMSIPLYAKYSFINKTNWSLYIAGGAIINIVAYRKMNMHWQDLKWDEGNAVEGISGSSNVYGSYSLSPGISYRIIRGLSIYAEPSIQGAPNIFNGKTFVKNSAAFTGLGTGIIYQF